MKNKIILVLLIAVSTIGTPANAKLKFGKQQSINKIVDINFKFKENESLYLGYLVNTQFVGLGVYLEDAGYVLGVSGEKDKYYPLPNNEVVKKLQDATILPNPLPTYKISLSDYILGYSLYLVILIILIFGLIKAKLTKKKSVNTNARRGL